MTEIAHFLLFQSAVGTRLMPLENIIEVIPMVGLEQQETDGEGQYVGLLHFRGRVIPVYSLSPQAVTDGIRADWFLVVSRSDDTEFALIATEVDDIIEVPRDKVTHVQGNQGQQVSVVEYEGSVLRVQHPEAIVQ